MENKCIKIFTNVWSVGILTVITEEIIIVFKVNRSFCKTTHINVKLIIKISTINAFSVLVNT